VRGGETVSDVLLVAALVTFFALAIGVVQVLGRMIDRDRDPGALADEPPDTNVPLNPNGPAGRAL
jgi:hypothetical protein